MKKIKTPSKTKPQVFTIGHSNHPIDTFLSLLMTNRVSMLIDVRSRPASRYQPHFNRKALFESLSDNDIDYRFAGDALGGLSGLSIEDTLFIDAMHKVVKHGTKKRIAMMCAEKDPKACHRAYKLSSWLLRNSDIVPTHITPLGNFDSKKFEDSMKSTWIWNEYGGQAE